MRQIIESGLGGAFATFITLFSAHIADYVIHPEKANILGHVLGSIANFLLQTNIFGTKSNHYNIHIVTKFIVAESVIALLNHIIFVVYHRHKVWYNKHVAKYLPKFLKDDDYSNTVARVLISTIIFFIISFPIRKYWIFK